MPSKYSTGEYIHNLRSIGPNYANPNASSTYGTSIINIHAMTIWNTTMTRVLSWNPSVSFAASHALSYGKASFIALSSRFRLWALSLRPRGRRRQRTRTSRSFDARRTRWSAFSAFWMETAEMAVCGTDEAGWLACWGFPRHKDQVWRVGFSMGWLTIAYFYKWESWWKYWKYPSRTFNASILTGIRIGDGC